MNIDHLRKQAKNLRALYPDLVSANPGALSLTRAQEVIAKTHGFPSWNAAVGQAAAKTDVNHTAQGTEPASNAAVIEELPVVRALRLGYAFNLGEEDELATELSDHDASPTKHAIGREASLMIRKKKDLKLLDRETEKLDELAEELGGMTGEFDAYTPSDLLRYMRAARRAVDRCPLYVDGWNVLAGTLFTQRKFDEAMAVAEPVATTLLDMLPKKGLIQVNYYALENRPFYRIVHCYLLLLHETGRHAEADALAKRMYALWPMDNMGFRFLLTKKSRDACE